MNDHFLHDDGAYVLGALSPEERAAFDAHLETCASCAARVAEIADLPRLLAGITPEELADPGPVPDTLLPRLVHEVRTTRRRRGLLAVAGAAVAAALAAVFTFLATQSTPPSPTSVAAGGREMHALMAAPVRARVALTAKEWGTRITLHCQYVDPNGSPLDYKMAAVDRDGDRYSLGGWRISGGQDITYVAGAPVPPEQIAKVLVTLRDGTPILRLMT